MTDVLHTIRRLLTKNGIPHETADDLPEKRLTARFPGEDGSDILLEASVDADGVFFTTRLRALTEEQLDVAEAFVAQAHKLIRTGQFHLLKKEPALCFEVQRLAGAQSPTAEELAPLLFVGPMMAQLYGPALDLVVDEGVSVEDALSAVEKIDGKPIMSFVLPDVPETFRPAAAKYDLFPGEFDEDEDEFFDAVGPDVELERGPLTDLIRDYYDEQNWKYEYDPAGNFFRMRMDSCCFESYQVVTIVREEEWFTTLTTVPVKVPADKRDLAEEFIARANYGMILGCFEMDPEKGIVQFKDTCLCGDTELDMEVVERHVDVGFRMCDRYGPAFLEMLYGGLSPADAIRKAEHDVLQKQSEPQQLPDRPCEEAAPPPSPVPERKGFFRRLLELLAPSEEEEEFNG